MRPEFSAISFFDVHKAEANLSRLEQQLAPTLMAPLASLLSESPDPDGALNLLERYTSEAPPDVLGDLARFPTGLTYLVAIFGYSAFLAETFLADPGLPVQFARDRNFTKLKSKEDLMQDYARFATTSPDHWLSAQLARFKRRNYLRIVLKDVLHLSTLGETTVELSALADVILANALLYCDQELEKRYGQPQYRDAQGRIARSGFSIISLGKLGGNELNYSSDIDLLFLYSHDGETAGGSEPESVVANKEYFVRLAHAITRTITQMTHQGQVFRVDLRLRPEGDQGDLAISLKSAREYYERRARDWELQMLIKARHSAGDPKLTREFLREVEPHIYGAPTDFEAVESVLWAREKISQKLRESHGHAVDVKRHRGGIRDIEFLTQCLQRLRGGRDPWVRSGGTLFALRKLNDKGWLSDRDFAALTSDYEFLRKVEHRVQLEMGHQTHRLPTDQEALDRLARRVSAEMGRGERPGDALLRQVQEAFSRVDEIYQRVVHPRAVSEAESAFDLKPLPMLAGEHGPYSYAATLHYLGAQAPELAEALREVPLSDRARKSATRFFAALLGSAERFAEAREQPRRVRHALEVLGASEYLGELLIHHPEELAVLDSVEPVPPDAVAAAQMQIALEVSAGLKPLPWATNAGLETPEKMALLRRHFRARVLELGAADVAALGSVFPALGRWSSLAAQSVATALGIAAQALDRNATTAAEPAARVPMVVLGLGRLGLNEFDLASDADLVFVAAPGTGREEMAFCTRLAEKTIEVLSSYTREGTLFAVDTRLRPRGQEGELVVTEDALVSYVSEAAHVWEALTYLKACPVAGQSELAQQTMARLNAVVFDRFASYPELEKELQRMRRRLEREVLVPPSNTKTAQGGYYDIDFAVSYLRLRQRMALPAGANMAQQIAALVSAGLLSVEDAQVLSDGAAFLRSVDHAIRLVTGRAADGLPEHVGHAEAVESLARHWGLIPGGESLATRLREIQEQVRNTYRRLLGV
ncbi:MAG: glutamine-synthetase adenylyltransferase [Terriglobia bacterium]